jgi:hypothetical protein
MPEPQLSVRSARARSLAHELSRIERRPIGAIVEDALLLYASARGGESAAAFLRRLQATAWDDLGLDAEIEAGRAPHDGIDL